MPEVPPPSSSFWNPAGRLVAFSFRALPRGFRFRAAVALARSIQPLIRRTGAYRERLRLHTDALRETSLDLVLTMLTRHGTEFDPKLRISGADLSAVDPAVPTIVVGPHTMLSAILHRQLEDAGVRPVIFAADETYCVTGTRRRAEVIPNGRHSLLRAHGMLRQNRTVMAMIDRDDEDAHAVVLRTSRGEWKISVGLICLALRHNARIVFMFTDLDPKWNVNTALAEVAMPADSKAVMAAFGQFLDRLGR